MVTWLAYLSSSDNIWEEIKIVTPLPYNCFNKPKSSSLAIGSKLAASSSMINILGLLTKAWVSKTLIMYK